MGAIIEVKNFVDCPDAIPFVAEQLFNQWFTTREGETLAGLIDRMRQGKANAIPIGLIAFVDGEPAGTVSLLEKDLDECGDLSPWLAGLLVFPEYRTLGVGRALIERLIEVAEEVGEPKVYLWTEIADIYANFGWRQIQGAASDKKAVVMLRETEVQR